MENKKFITLEENTIKPEYILLNSTDLNEYKSALEQLIKLSGKLESFKSLYFEKNPIKFYKNEENKVLLYESFEIQDFINEISKITELKSQIDLFFENISKECVYVSGDYYFRELICEYAMLDKENVKYYTNFLSAIEEDTDLEADDVDSIIEKHGWCNETVDLIIYRYFANSPVDHGKEQFINAIEEGLSEFLENKSNLDYFVKIVVEYMHADTEWEDGDDEEDSEISYTLEKTKEIFDYVFGEDTEESEKYYTKAKKAWKKME